MTCLAAFSHTAASYLCMDVLYPGCHKYKDKYIREIFNKTEVKIKKSMRKILKLITLLIYNPAVHKIDFKICEIKLDITEVKNRDRNSEICIAP